MSFEQWCKLVAENMGMESIPEWDGWLGCYLADYEPWEAKLAFAAEEVSRLLA